MGRYFGLVLDSLALLAGFVLAFGAITIIWRRHWESFGATESLLARLAAAFLLAMIGLAGIVQFVYLAALQSTDIGGFQGSAPVPEGRNQALGVTLGALALAVIAVLRIELYHRHVTGISRRESDDEWQAEEPEEKQVPRER